MIDKVFKLYEMPGSAVVSVPDSEFKCPDSSSFPSEHWTMLSKGNRMQDIFTRSYHLVIVAEYKILISIYQYGLIVISNVG